MFLFSDRKTACYLLCSLLLQQMSFQIFRLLIFLFHTENGGDVSQAHGKDCTCQSSVLYCHICHFRISSALSISPPSKAQSKKMKMKAFLIHSPASAASAADSRGCLLFGGPIQGFSRVMHRFRRLAHVSSEVRPDPTNPFWLLFPHTGAIPVIFNAPSSSFLIEAPLQERWFVYTDSVYMAGSKSHQDS